MVLWLLQNDFMSKRMNIKWTQKRPCMWGIFLISKEIYFCLRRLVVEHVPGASKYWIEWIRRMILLMYIHDRGQLHMVSCERCSLKKNGAVIGCSLFRARNWVNGIRTQTERMRSWSWWGFAFVWKISGFRCKLKFIPARVGWKM